MADVDVRGRGKYVPELKLRPVWFISTGYLMEELFRIAGIVVTSNSNGAPSTLIILSGPNDEKNGHHFCSCIL